MPGPHLLKKRLELLPGVRLDGALQKLLEPDFPDLSRRQIKLALQHGWITLTETPSRKFALSPSFKVDANPISLELELNWSALQKELLPRALLPRAQGCALEILYEDDRLLVFNKPSGMPSAPLHSDEQDTAVHHALAYFPALPSTHPKEPGLLHRLDTGTSGCLAFAKTQEAYETLKKAWKQGLIKKFYIAHVSAAPTGGLPLEIRLPLGHDPKSSRRMRIADRKIRGKPLPAHTTLLEVKKLSTHIELLIQLHTGVMHQIRVHLASLGLPILGDTVYGGESAPRLGLHCLRLVLPGPLVVTAPGFSDQF